MPKRDFPDQVRYGTILKIPHGTGFTPIPDFPVLGFQSLEKLTLLNDRYAVVRTPHFLPFVTAGI